MKSKVITLENKAAGEIEPGLGQWWTDFQAADERGKEQMLSQLGQQGPRKKRRRRKPAAQRQDGKFPARAAAVGRAGCSSDAPSPAATGPLAPPCSCSAPSSLLRSSSCSGARLLHCSSRRCS